MSVDSVSKIGMNLEIKGKLTIKCELKRHLAPKTVGNMIRTFPLEGNAHKLGDSFVYLETSINVGSERQRTQFKKGDVAFMASSGSVCFFTNDSNTTKPMTPIGKMISNFEALAEIKTGDIFVLTQADV